MEHFLHALIDPTAVVMLFIVLFAFSTQVVPVYWHIDASGQPTRPVASFALWPILWIILGLLALIAWLFIVF